MMTEITPSPGPGPPDRLLSDPAQTPPSRAAAASCLGARQRGAAEQAAATACPAAVSAAGLGHRGASHPLSSRFVRAQVIRDEMSSASVLKLFLQFSSCCAVPSGGNRSGENGRAGPSRRFRFGPRRRAADGFPAAAGRLPRVPQREWPGPCGVLNGSHHPALHKVPVLAALHLCSG